MTGLSAQQLHKIFHFLKALKAKCSALMKPVTQAADDLRPTAALIKQRTLIYCLRLYLSGTFIVVSRYGWLLQLPDPRRNQYKPLYLILFNWCADDRSLSQLLFTMDRRGQLPHPLCVNIIIRSDTVNVKIFYMTKTPYKICPNSITSLFGPSILKYLNPFSQNGRK